MRPESPRMIRRAPLSALLLLASLAAACTSSIYGWTVRTNSTPRAESFPLGVFEREPVAVFEALAPANLRGTELGLAHYLEEIVAAIAPTVRVISFQETVNRINARGLAAEYVRMRTVLEQSN